MAPAIRADAEAVRVEPKVEAQSSTRYAAVGVLRRIDFAKGSSMPIFEYKCAKCGHVMEVLLKSRTGATPTCEKCGGACPGGTCPMS